MSLFNFTGGGDIWSSAGFAFVSPINDILDKETFTLEEILAQDEVLQEVKSLNIKLVEFLSKESSVRDMMTYLAEPPPQGASDNRVFKFPYMSCEIICCEVPEILKAVAKDGGGGDGGDSYPLLKLFSLLDEEGQIDAHRAGYLLKILTVLLKHRCAATTSFVNDQGVKLFRKVVRHLGDFSVMQVAKLLLLPKHAALQDINATGLMGDGRGIGGGGDDGMAPAFLWCNWSEDPEILKILLAEFKRQPPEETSGGGDAEAGGVGQGDTEELKWEEGGDEDGGGESSDVHLHLSELLLALIAQSSPESSFLKRIFSNEAIEPLVGAATLTKEQGRRAQGSQAALQILAALADRLVRPLPPSEPSLLHCGETTEMQVDSPDGFGGGGHGGNNPSSIGVDGEALERGLRDLIPPLCAYLRGHTEDPSKITSQTRREQPRMGPLRLQVVRFLETLVGMDNPKIDQALIKEHAMATCLEMMFTYETASMLHTSVAASVVAILVPAASSPVCATGPSMGAGAGAGMIDAASPQSSDESAAAAVAAGGDGEESGAASRPGADSAGDGGGGGTSNAGPGGHRELFQRHLFEDCRLVERILEAVALNEDAEKAQPIQASTGVDSGAEPVAAAATDRGAEASSDCAAVAGDGAGGGGTDTGESVDAADAAAAAATRSPDTAPRDGETAVEQTLDPAAAAAAATATETPEAVAAAATSSTSIDGQDNPGNEATAGSGERAGEGGDVAAAAAVGLAPGESGAAAHGVQGTRRRSRPGRRLGHMGHVLSLSRTIVGAERGEGTLPSGAVATAGGRGILGGSGGAGSSSGGEGAVGGDPHQGAGSTTGEEGERESGAVPSRKSFVAELLAERECAEHWQEFVNTTLATELSRQLNPLGGFAVPSREEENQLSSDFPDEAVDMDDTTGLLENISRMQAAAPGGGGGEDGSGGGGLPSGPKDSFLDDDDDDDDDEFFGASASGDNSGLSMPFGSVDFMSSSGGGGGIDVGGRAGSAWDSLAGEHGSSNAGGNGSTIAGSAFGSTSGDSSPSVAEGWANFADFGGGAQQSTDGSGATGAAGGGGVGGGGFANFDPVFAINTPPPPGPSGFAPTPPSWAPRAGDGSGGGGATASSGTDSSGSGSAGGGGFSDFPQFGDFADFSAMVDDSMPSPPAPQPIAGGAFAAVSGDSGGGGGGGGDEDDRMDEEGEDGVEEPGDPSLTTGNAAMTGLGLLLGAAPREDKCDSVDAMMGSDEEEEKEIDGIAGDGLETVSP